MEFGWINVYNIIIVGIMLIPNIFYGCRNRNAVNKCKNKFMNVTEQIGRYGCIVFMILSIGTGKFSFGSWHDFLLYCFGNAVLLFLYIVIWIMLFLREKAWKSMVLSILPVMIFLLCGITLNHVPLIAAAVVLALGHPYVTWQNVKDGKRKNRDRCK